MTGLQTDLYELRMALSYLRRGMAGPATFSLFARRLPADRGFLVAAGAADCTEFLQTFRFTHDEIAHLRDRLGFEDADLLRDVRFTGDVWAVPEGRVVFAGEPLLEVTAPVAEAQLVETALLNTITFHTTIASKAARCVLAAGPATLVDFAYRRTQGLAAAAVVARCSAIAGFAATSNTEAARRYGLEATGTMAHSYVEAFPDERAAFRAFATDFPHDTTFLVDTYDTLGGVEAAIDVTRELDLPGPVGVRLDSGDLVALSFGARARLDAAGLRDARIVASGGLDEYAVADLVLCGAPIDAFGVGTRMGVSADAPSLDSAYKLVSYGAEPVMKLSPGKATLPGAKQVFRGRAEDGDLLGLRDEPPPPGHAPLLEPVMRGGRPVAGPRDVAAARTRFEADRAWLPPEARRIREPAPVPVHLTRGLARLRDEVRSRHAVHGLTLAPGPTG